MKGEGALSLFCCSSSSTPCRAKMASPQGNRHHAQRTSAVGGPEVRLFQNSAGENLNIFLLLYYVHNVCSCCTLFHRRMSTAQKISLRRRLAESTPRGWGNSLTEQSYNSMISQSSGYRSNHFSSHEIANVPNQTVLGRFRCVQIGFFTQEGCSLYSYVSFALVQTTVLYRFHLYVYTTFYT